MTRLFAGTPWDQPPQCERCGEPEAACNCSPPEKPAKKPISPAGQTLRLMVEKRKRGKSVTVVRGLSAADNDLTALLTRLKSHCGAGGTTKEDHLEIQGDHLEKIRLVLTEIGFRVK